MHVYQIQISLHFWIFRASKSVMIPLWNTKVTFLTSDPKVSCQHYLRILSWNSICYLYVVHISHCFWLISLTWECRICINDDVSLVTKRFNSYYRRKNQYEFPKGPCTNYIDKILKIFVPPPSPFQRQVYQILSLCGRQPPSPLLIYVVCVLPINSIIPFCLEILQTVINLKI